MKPILLSLFETYIIKIDVKAWRPALKCIILSLLPGLDDPASEEYERTHVLLNHFRNALKCSPSGGESSPDSQDDRFFWQNLFIATISSANRRPGALAYLEKHLPRMGPEASQHDTKLQGAATLENGADSGASAMIKAVISPEPGLLIRCFAAGLLDDQLLIQRGFLELLVTHLPLNSDVLRYHVTAHDREFLVSAATSVVVRREMSLNRRLWIWFLGQAASPETEHSGTASPQSGKSGTGATTEVMAPVQYFAQYGSIDLVEGLLKQFQFRTAVAVTRARPFRICLSLMDRWEIGGIVLPHVFKPAMQSVYQYKAYAPSEDAFSEIRKSASTFFDAVQSKLIWKELASMVLTALDENDPAKSTLEPSITRTQLELVRFIITTFNIREEEMLTVHIPLMLLLLLYFASNIVELLKSQQSHQLISEISESLLQSALFLQEQLPERTFSEDDLLVGDAQFNKDSVQSLPTIISKFYDDAAESHESTFTSYRGIVQDGLLNSAFNLVLACLRCNALAPQLNAALSISAKMLGKSSSSTSVSNPAILSSLALAVARPSHGTVAGCARPIGHLSTLELLHSMMPLESWQNDLTVRQIARKLVNSLWLFISPSNPRHNAEAVRAIWRLHHLSPDPGMIEAAITAFLHRSDEGHIDEKPNLQGLHRFTSFWTHTVSMFRSLSNRRSSAINADSSSIGKSEKPLDGPETIAKPLMLVLDLLRHADTPACMLISGWLQTAPEINL